MNINIIIIKTKNILIALFTIIIPPKISLIMSKIRRLQRLLLQYLYSYSANHIHNNWEVGQWEVRGGGNGGNG